jgi:hypothetical protein
MQSYNYRLLKEYRITWTVIYLELQVDPIPKSSYVWTSEVIDKSQHIPTVSMNPHFNTYLRKNKLNNFIDCIIDKEDE